MLYYLGQPLRAGLSATPLRFGPAGSLPLVGLATIPAAPDAPPTVQQPLPIRKVAASRWSAPPKRGPGALPPGPDAPSTHCLPCRLPYGNRPPVRPPCQPPRPRPPLRVAPALLPPHRHRRCPRLSRHSPNSDATTATKEVALDQPSAPPPCRARPEKRPHAARQHLLIRLQATGQKACRLRVKLAFKPRRQKQGPLRGEFYWGVPQTPSTMPRLKKPGHLPRGPQPPAGRPLLPHKAGFAECPLRARRPQTPANRHSCCRSVGRVWSGLTSGFALFCCVKYSKIL